MLGASMSLVREIMDRETKGRRSLPDQYRWRGVGEYSDTIKTGADAVFFEVLPGIGFKFFDTAYAAQENYALQKLAAENDIAPAVGRFVGKFTYKNGDFYGYFTQTVDKIGADFKAEDSDISRSSGGITNLYRTGERIGVLLGDMHIYNYGLIGNRLVAIDFSRSGSSLEVRGEIEAMKEALV